jgi:hypothetical protein
MNRFFLSVAVAALGLITLAVSQTQADEHFGRGSSRSHGDEGRYESRREHEFRGDRRFDYGRHGYQSFSWSHRRWSDYYRCYCYYSPSYGWCFYEPTFSYYVPVSHYFEVYPQADRTEPAPVFPPPTAIQQTTVIVGSNTPATVPIVPSAPIPTAVQQTKVIAAGGPSGELIPAPSVVPGPVAAQQTKVGPGAP